MQRRLGNLVGRIGRIALGTELDLEHRQRADLLRHPVEAALDLLAQLVGDGKVASLDLDPHGTPLVRRGCEPRCSPEATGTLTMVTDANPQTAICEPIENTIRARRPKF